MMDRIAWQFAITITVWWKREG